MMPAQTSQLLAGGAAAVIYGAVIMATGSAFLILVLRRHASIIVPERIRFFSVLWLAFVIGQGIVGVLWLALSLAGILYPALIWLVCLSAAFLLCLRLVTRSKSDAWLPRLMWSDLSSLLYSRSWYFWVGVSIVVLSLLHGVMAFLPPTIDDALKHYLVWARTIAVTHKIAMQPSLHPYYGLLPMQVEMHWAALFAISNETAVTVWDYLCALSFLAGTGLLAWTLTSSRRIALVAVLIMFSTPAFYAMIGAGKIDNASAQYGIAAFLLLALWPALGRRAAILAGLCVGFSLGSRYTNIIILPGVALFAIMAVYTNRPSFPSLLHAKKYWLTTTLLSCMAAVMAGAPMLLKNWLLVDCPLAPQVGCQETFWAGIYRLHTSALQNISIRDFALYPFVWTFTTRDSMLGNISPLFIGLGPFLLVYRHSRKVKAALIAAVAALSSMMTWLLIEPLVLYTRFFLVPLALLAIALGAGVVAAEQDLRRYLSARLLVRGAIGLVLLLLLFESRGVLHAGRYLASMETRADRYQSGAGYDVAAWLSGHVRPGQRVALGNYKGHRYFMKPNVLLSAESAEEFQWLWDHGNWLYGGSGGITPSPWLPDFWRFYVNRGFTYVVVAKSRAEDALSAWPGGLEGVRLNVAAEGRANNVFQIERDNNSPRSPR